MADWLTIVMNDVLMQPRMAGAAVAVFVAGFMRGFVGFGGAMIVVPALALAWGPLLAVPASTIVGLPAALQLLPTAIREAERAVVVPIAVAVFQFAPVGTWLLVSIDPELMKIAIGGLVVGMTLMLARGWKLKQRVPGTMLFLAGAAGGLVQGAAGVGGPPVVAVALARAGSAAQQRANVIGVMTAIALSAWAPLLFFGLLTTESIVVGVALTPVYALGTWLGAHCFSTGGARYYRRAALVVLGLVGLVTAAVALSDYVS